MREQLLKLFREFPSIKLSDDNQVIQEDPIRRDHDFLTISAAQAFDRPPTCFIAAAYRFVYLEPAPSEVWEYLPIELYILTYFSDSPFVRSLQYKDPLGHIYAPFAPLQDPDHLGTAPPLSSHEKEALTQAFPVEPGRAGAKTLLDMPDTLRTLGNNTLSRLIARRLLSAKCSFNATFASACILLPFMSDMSPFLALWLLRLPDRSFWSLSPKEAAKFLKELHTMIRVTRLLPGFYRQLLPEESRQLYGIDCLPGRSELWSYKADEEIIMRIGDPTIRAIPQLIPLASGKGLTYNPITLSKYLKVGLRSAVSTALRPRVRILPFSEWYALRMSWAASGGAPGATVIWKEGDSSERLNKRGALLLIPEEHINNIIRSALPPVLYSKAAPKFENAKIRAIWNTSVEHYIIQAYILDQFEGNCLPDTWNSGANTVFSKLRSDIRRLYALTEKIGLMWDYSDFNINHTHDAMCDCFDAAVNIMLERMYTQDPNHRDRAIFDLQACLSWVKRARRNTFLLDPDSAFGAYVLRSMQSGERGTAFQNTFLSRAYSHVLEQVALDLFNRPLLLAENRYHQGDDVFSLVNSVPDGVLVASLFNLLGYAGQLYKITLDYGPRGEFLRLHYDGTINKISGYPIRSFMGLIGGEFFRESVVDPGDRAMAFVDQFSKVTRRGGHPPNVLLNTLINKHASLTYTDQSARKHRVAAVLDSLFTPSALGGYGANPISPGGLTLSAKHLSVFPAQPFSQRATPTLLVDQSSTGIAYFLPSGGGKSTLCRQLSELCVDHDKVRDWDNNRKLLFPLLRRGERAGDWAPLNAVYKADVLPKDKVLLTFGYDTLPTGFVARAFLYVLGHQGPRYYKDSLEAGIRHARQKKLPIIACQDFNQLRTFLLTDVQRIRGAHIIRPTMISPIHYWIPSNRSLSRPSFQLPLVPTRIFFGGQHGQIPDINLARQYGCSNNELGRVKRQILDSALPGAYPAADLSRAMASFAAKLESWNNQYLSSFEPYVTSVPPLVLTEAFTGWCDDFLSAIYRHVWSTGASSLVARLRDFYASQDDEEPGDVSANRPMYGALQSLTRLAGFSSFAAYKTAISALPVNLDVDPGPGARIICAIRRQRQTATSRAGNWFLSKRILANTMSPTSRTTFLSNLEDYFSGSISFYPPISLPLPPPAISISRLIVLMFLEANLTSVFSLPRVTLLDYTAVLEAYTLRRTINILQTFPFPNGKGTLTYSD